MSETKRSLFELTVNDLNGTPVPLRQYRGSICLIANISTKSENAEKCLKNLYLTCATSKNKNVSLLLFPCFQFGETERIEELTAFVSKICPGVGKLFQPIDVNGSGTSELYKWLKKHQLGRQSSLVTSNFTIFITTRQGIPWGRMNSEFSSDKLKEMIDLCQQG